MLQLKQIELYQFKNYSQKTLHFGKQVVGLVGNNGVGKTNLLDAIHYLCFTKSYFSTGDAAVVKQGAAGLRLQGVFNRNGDEEKVVCIIRENGRKEFYRNDEEYKRFSDHIGLFPAVTIAPDDIELITGTSDVRRKFIDTLLSQLDRDYLRTLIEYNKVLQQRNSFLKASAERGRLDENLLETLTEQLVQRGNSIFKRRREFLKPFLEEVSSSYQHIAGTSEVVDLIYSSQLFEADFGHLVLTFREKDRLLQRTTVGIHRDDIELRLHGDSFKNVASQGQRKSLLFALKLKEFDELKAAKGFAPLLLLDDVFEKLDPGRIQNLLSYVCTNTGSQVFISDTHKERLEQSLNVLHIDHELLAL